MFHFVSNRTKHACMTVVLWWMVTGFSGATGREGGEIGQPSTLGSVLTECPHCIEISNGDERVKCLWVRVSRKANNGKEAAERTFYEKLEMLCLLLLLLMWDFSFPDISWKYSTIEKKQTRRFLEWVEDIFLTLVVRESTEEGASLEM